MGRPKTETKRKAHSDVEDNLSEKRKRTRSESVVSNGSNGENEDAGSEVTFKPSKTKTEKSKVKRKTPTKSPVRSKGEKGQF